MTIFVLQLCIWNWYIKSVFFFSCFYIILLALCHRVLIRGITFLKQILSQMKAKLVELEQKEICFYNLKKNYFTDVRMVKADILRYFGCLQNWSTEINCGFFVVLGEVLAGFSRWDENFIFSDLIHPLENLIIL